MGRKKKIGGDGPGQEEEGGGAAGSSSDAAAAPAAPQLASLPAGAAAQSPALQALLANPGLLLANPMLAVQMLNTGLLSNAAAAMAKAAPPQPMHSSIDPDVQELCDHFHIEDRHVHRLNEIMKNRQETFEGDMLKLWEKLEDAREPAGLLVVKMREMEEGTFIGKQKIDKELATMVKRYNLDRMAESRLSDILARFEPEKKAEMYADLDRHLEVSNRPSAMVMMLLRKIADGAALGRPGPPAPGSYLDRKMREEAKDRDRDRDRRGGDRRDGDRDRRERDRDDKADRKDDRDRRSRSRGRR